MGLARRMKTIGKVEIPEGAKKEAELLYLHNIVAIVEEHEIPTRSYHEFRPNTAEVRACVASYYGQERSQVNVNLR